VEFAAYDRFFALVRVLLPHFFTDFKLLFFSSTHLSVSISILLIVFDRFILNGQFLYNSSIIFSWFAFSTSGRRGRFR
jgi:hypothetical protein